jgi:hypothetical protein
MIKLISKLIGNRLSEIFVSNYCNKLELTKEDNQTVVSILQGADNLALEKALRILLANDKHLYFNAQDAKSQDMVRGAYNRTLYILNSIKGSDVKKKVVLKNPRVLE